MRTVFPTFSHQAQPDSEPGLGRFYLIESHVVSSQVISNQVVKNGNCKNADNTEVMTLVSLIEMNVYMFKIQYSCYAFHSFASSFFPYAERKSQKI